MRPTQAIVVTNKQDLILVEADVRRFFWQLHAYYSGWDRKVEGEHGQLRPDLVHLRRAFSDAGIAAGHGLTLEGLGAAISKRAVLQAELRQAHYQAQRQVTRLDKLELNVRKTLARVREEDR